MSELENDKELENDTLPEKSPVLRITAMPKDTNPGGNIFGGWLMSQIDIAGAVVAIERAKGRVATVKAHNIEFIHPVLVGDIVSCYASVYKTGRTSLVVNVDVYIQRNAADPIVLKVSKAELVYVALDTERKPRPVPNLAKQ